MAFAFDPIHYMGERSDVFTYYVNAGAKGGTGMEWAEFAEYHYNNFGWKEGSNPNSQFNTLWYLQNNIDVANVGVNPFQHYLTHGVYEGRAPNANFPKLGAEFDAEAYLAANSDLGENGIDTPQEAYAHFVLHGQFEKRPGAPAVGSGEAGQTFTLTTGLDFANSDNAFVNGAIASDFRFTKANEKIIALAGTLNPTDVLIDNSSDDNDTLEIRTTAANSLAGALGGTIQNIETISVIANGDNSGVINLANSGITGARSLTISGSLGAALTLNNYVSTGITEMDFSGVTGAGVTVTPGAATTAAVKISGGAGNDTLSGGAGDDVINGGAGDDTINGGAGNNTLNGGAGNDTITATSGNNTVDLGAGTGPQFFTATHGNNTVAATGATGTVSVTLGNGNNSITLGDSADILNIGNGNNTISTGAGDDFITVGNGDNTIDAGAGNDIFIVGNGDNTIDAGAGSDNITVGNGNNTINGGAGNDIIIVGAGPAGAGNNTITGGAGADTITINNGTNGGAQTIIIGAGDTGVTTATADIITGFTTARDTLSLGIADGVGGVGGNFVVVNDTATTVNAAVSAAAGSFTGGVLYALVDNGTNSFLVFDRDGDGTADGAISLVGITGALFDATDIVA